MKTTNQREGFLNRNTDGLPDKVCLIKIVAYSVFSESIYQCTWIPFDKSKYTEANMPDEGYLGTATVVHGRSTGMGFHAWEQNDSEFIWYSK